MAKPKIFVSHSSFDTPFASMLLNDLNAAGADAWMDTNDLGAGNFQQRISEALDHCEWFLLVLTRNALNSDWVCMEVDAAIRLKNQGEIKELIFIKAADLDTRELPALWGIFNVFDAFDYEAALDRTLKSVGLQDAADNSQEDWRIGQAAADMHLMLYEENFVGALEISGEILWDDPYNVEAWWGKADALTALGRVQEADNATRIASQMENIAALWEKAGSLYELGRVREADEAAHVARQLEREIGKNRTRK